MAMKLVLDVENTVVKREGKLHLDPFEPSNNLVMVGVYPDDGEPEVYTFDHVEYVEHTHERKEHINRIQQLLDEAEVLICHNISHDLQWLWACGFNYTGKVWDTMLAEYVMQRGVKEPLSLEAVAERRNLEFQKQDTLKQYMKQGVPINEIPHAELTEYLIGDLRTTMALYYDQQVDLNDSQNKGLLATIDLTMETSVLLTKIYKNGFTVDPVALREVQDEFEQEKAQLILDLNKHIKHLMGDTQINLNSPEQMSWVIYSRKPKDKTQWANSFDPRMKPEEFKRFINGSSDVIRKTRAVQCAECKGSGGFYKTKVNGQPFKNMSKCPTCNGSGFVYKPTTEVAGLKFTPSNTKWHSANGFSTSKDVLGILQGVAKQRGLDEAATFLQKLSRLSAVDTYLSSFIGGIANYTKDDGLLHVRLTQHMTSTGRFSGRDPNMQNMPRGGTFPVKKVFVSRWDGGKIMEADFAQLEFRVAAFLSQDETAIKEVTEGFDVHSYTAQVISEAGQATSRQEAKAHTFAPLYGATGFGRTPAEAAYYTHFTEKYKGIARWHRELAKEVLSTRKIRTPSGREFSFKDVVRRRDGTVTNFTAIKNYPVQSFATADIVPAVLIEIDKKIASLQSMIVNSVHDSIVIDVHPNEERLIVETIAQINNELINIINNKFNINFNVPLLLEAKMGVNWLAQKEV
jgi:DNA polymerase I-like protein with 3'-5' exonuclease and polymerase domains